MTVASPALYLLQNMSSGAGTPSLFSIINGTPSAATGNDPITTLLLAEKNETKEVGRQENEPQTKRDISRFLAVVAKAPDLKTLMQDPIARKVLMTANGLGDQADYAALAVKALSSDTTKTGNLASRLSDTRWLTIAKTYDFANKGLALLKNPAALDTITQGYAEVQWREAQDASTPGLSAALDFRSRANTITSVDQILGDANLRKVVTTALGLPLEIAYQPLQAQEKAISSRIDIAKFKDPKFVEQFTRRFLLANQDQPASNSSSNSTPLVNLFV